LIVRQQKARLARAFFETVPRVAATTIQPKVDAFDDSQEYVPNLVMFGSTAASLSQHERITVQTDY
jgi:hypothetical protein